MALTMKSRIPFSFLAGAGVPLVADGTATRVRRRPVLPAAVDEAGATAATLLPNPTDAIATISSLDPLGSWLAAIRIVLWSLVRLRRRGRRGRDISVRVVAIGWAWPQPQAAYPHHAYILVPGTGGWDTGRASRERSALLSVSESEGESRWAWDWHERGPRHTRL
jgi:hypothetical protein